MKEEHQWKRPEPRKLEGKELEAHLKGFSDVEESIARLKKSKK